MEKQHESDLPYRMIGLGLGVIMGMGVCESRHDKLYDQVEIRADVIEMELHHMKNG